MGIILKNLMETLVLQKLAEIITEADCCHCDKCQADIASYALNRLPSKYVATHEGEIYAKLDTLSVQYSLDMVKVIMQGIMIVKKAPKHTLEGIENRD